MPNTKKEHRTKSIKIRVTDDEFKQLNERKTETQLASWIRKTCLGATPITPVDPSLIRELSRIGNNLNQITKHVNIAKEIDSKTLTAINKMQTDLNELANFFARSKPIKPIE